ncbi:SMP-30/gluconolactonase/LRE family protein [Streptomyces abyssomicinicus]|uniref:SMP-30/gluconolactonase/LRE family protein n=1 Tax=Streptomyces abyssomicinicus TaxID=574929 RepID=UPI001FE6096F|nr:SMP-30/gluconolactonase/LRE family protein [Streptomyces abyssomicinicus]
MSRTLSIRTAVASAAVLAAVVPVALPAAAAPAQPSRAAAGHYLGPDVIETHAADVYPEGFAWDPTRRAFIATSALSGDLSVIELDGTVTELAPSIGMVSTLGVRVDTARNRIIVAYSDFWIRQRLEVGDQPPTSGVAIFALDTGELQRRVDLSGGRERTFANDLTFDDKGNIYVTDSVSDTLQRIDRRGRVSTVVSDPRFAADIVGLNGIVWHPDGYLLALRYDTGTMYRIKPDAPYGRRVTEVRLPRPMVGTDGLQLRPDGSVVVVTNSIGEAVGVPGGVDGVSVLSSRDGWRSATLRSQVQPWPVGGPTTVALTPYGDYVLSGQVGEVLAGRTSDLIVLRRLPGATSSKESNR